MRILLSIFTIFYSELLVELFSLWLLNRSILTQVHLYFVFTAFKQSIDLIENKLSISLLSTHIFLYELNEVSPFLYLLFFQLLKLYPFELPTKPCSFYF